MSKKIKTHRGTFLCDLVFEKLLKYINGFVVITDQKGRVICANKEYLKFFRCCEKDAINGYWIDQIMPEAKRRQAQKIFDDIRKEKVLRIFETPLFAAKGRTKHLCWTSIPLKEKRKYFYMFIARQKHGVCGARPGRHVIVFRGTHDKDNKAHKRIVKILFDASAISEPCTAEHASRVMSLAVRLAKELKLTKERIERLRASSLLHDLGKLVVDKKILFKSGNLTKNEFEKMKKHSYWSTEIVRFVYFLRDIMPIIADHHENYNGCGYPRGLKAVNIPLEAKILSTVDIYEALTADRPYRKGFSKPEAIAIMEAERGHKLDPYIANVFLNMVKRGKL